MVVARSTVSTDLAVKRPRWVAVPSWFPVIVRVVGGHVGGQFTCPLVASVNEPRKGSSVPPSAGIWAGATAALVGDVGESKTWPLQAAVNTHTVRTIGRIGLPPVDETLVPGFEFTRRASTTYVAGRRGVLRDTFEKRLNVDLSVFGAVRVRGRR